MWCAVIERALLDASGAAGGVGSPAERIRMRDEARRWFENDGPDFRRICEAAGLEPEAVRMRALSLIEGGMLRKAG